jgi:hypothetical protein
VTLYASPFLYITPKVEDTDVVRRVISTLIFYIETTPKKSLLFMIGVRNEGHNKDGAESSI